jgi:hypothetical protein
MGHKLKNSFTMLSFELAETKASILTAESEGVGQRHPMFL